MKQKIYNILGVLLIIGGLLCVSFYHKNNTTKGLTVTEQSSDQDEKNTSVGEPLTQISTHTNNQETFNDVSIAKLADNTLANGTVPLGDYKYVTDGPKKGYVYLCSVRKDTPGSIVNGPWIHGTTWNFLQKISISGNISWKNAEFSSIVSGIYRILSGNGLPINHTAGVFPVLNTDEATKYDKNPNTIQTQSLKLFLPLTPEYSETPYCMGGEVGVMLSGVPIFNAFDAGLRDAQAHELQDSCGGHPQGSGQYHYHGLSSCFKDINIKTVLGYALDGFPITGPKVTESTYLTTEDLDICHGITSTITMNGKEITTYHYVLTKDFPYSVSCFRGNPASRQVIPQSNQNIQPASGPSTQKSSPPQEALSVCSNKTPGATCTFIGGRGETITGRCQTILDQNVACVPTF